MAFDVQRLLRLWSDPLPDDPAAAFRELYADPVRVNGVPVAVEDLVTRARAVQGTFDRLHADVLAVVDGGAQVAVAFRMSGRQVGPWTTTAGVLEPTGRELVLRVVDVLTVDGGRITEVVMVADELGALTALDAVALVPPS
ncbi:ester cyclase [Geodermatophilus sp. SYSU D00708]